MRIRLRRTVNLQKRNKGRGTGKKASWAEDGIRLMNS
jgi:hypothetical protein